MLPVLILPTERLDAWGRWAQGAWAAFTSRKVPVTAGVSLRGAAPLVLRLGEESLIQRIIDGKNSVRKF